MGDGVEVAKRLAADALGGRGWIGPLGVGVFEALEFGEERVVFAVRNFGLGFDVVEMVVAFEGTAEGVDSLFFIRGCSLSERTGGINLGCGWTFFWVLLYE